jgi:hypothetical protein
MHCNTNDIYAVDKDKARVYAYHIVRKKVHAYHIIIHMGTATVRGLKTYGLTGPTSRLWFIRALPTQTLW